MKLWQSLPRLEHRPALTCLTGMHQIQQICKMTVPGGRPAKEAAVCKGVQLAVTGDQTLDVLSKVAA